MSVPFISMEHRERRSNWVRKEVAERYIRRFKERLNADRSKNWKPRPDYAGDDWRYLCMWVGYNKTPRKIRIIP